MTTPFAEKLMVRMFGVIVGGVDARTTHARSCVNRGRGLPAISDSTNRWRKEGYNKTIEQWQAWKVSAATGRKAHSPRDS
jgi:hypothetical protein